MFSKWFRFGLQAILTSASLLTVEVVDSLWIIVDSRIRSVASLDQQARTRGLASFGHMRIKQTIVEDVEKNPTKAADSSASPGHSAGAYCTTGQLECLCPRGHCPCSDVLNNPVTDNLGLLFGTLTARRAGGRQPPTPQRFESPGACGGAPKATGPGYHRRPRHLHGPPP